LCTHHTFDQNLLCGLRCAEQCKFLATLTPPRSESPSGRIPCLQPFTNSYAASVTTRQKALCPLEDEYKLSQYTILYTYVDALPLTPTHCAHLYAPKTSLISGQPSFTFVTETNQSACAFQHVFQSGNSSLPVIRRCSDNIFVTVTVNRTSVVIFCSRDDVTIPTMLLTGRSTV
jgi:hypothetical protein